MNSPAISPLRAGQVLEIIFAVFTPRITVHSERELTVELAFAGGARRNGNLLILHRPYLAEGSAESMTDADREAAQRAAMNAVRDYLKSVSDSPSRFLRREGATHR